MALLESGGNGRCDTLERILVMDEKNYSPDLEEIYRVAVRGIILRRRCGA